jgi:hypothetical protein
MKHQLKVIKYLPIGNASRTEPSCGVFRVSAEIVVAARTMPPLPFLSTSIFSRENMISVLLGSHCMSPAPESNKKLVYVAVVHASP